MKTNKKTKANKTFKAVTRDQFTIDNKIIDETKASTGELSNRRPSFKSTIPWVDKYRPLKIDDVIHQPDVKKLLKNIVLTGNMQHLLFYGPAGTGKTSSILAIANELFGPNKIDERVIELNASDERGINIVRNKIVTLAKTSVSEKDPDYVCPPYKIIILDEADAMTVEAQSALRKIMEDNSSITRFCFVCNFINQIIGPITSRCAKFRFKPIDIEQMKDRLLYIANKENMNISNESVDMIYSATNGDMRKAITLLQHLNYLNKYIEVNDVCTMACIIAEETLKNIMDICTNPGDSAINITNLTNKLIMEGLPLSNILEQLVRKIVTCKDLNDKMKSIICLHISNTEQRLTCGADEYMQLLSVFMCIKNISNGLKSVYDM
jgi:replication factor C subunit 2/4